MNEYKEPQILECFNDILESIVNAQNFIRNKTKKEFLSDSMSICAVTRCFDNISRIARIIKRLNRHGKYNHLPWHEIIEMSRKINHNYQKLPPAVLWQTVEEEFDEFEKQVRSILGDNIRQDIPKHSVKLNRIKFVPDKEETLTPTLLVGQITPYLLALSDLQKVIDSVKGQFFKPIGIKSISQNTPISIGLDGAAEATEVVRDMVVPWRRKHSKEIAQLEEQEKLVQIESTRAEVLETRARAQKERVETKKIEIETEVEIERRRLENEKLRLEIEEARINLALKILDKLSPELSQEQRILYVMHLLKPLGVIANSPLLLTSETG